MLRVDSIWSGPGVAGGGITQLFFNNDAGDAQACVDAVEDFWNAFMPIMSDRCTVEIADAVYELAPADGSLVGIVPVTSPGAQQGDADGDALPPATQLLIRATTGLIVNNRVVRGRVFIPGMLEANSSDIGEPSSGLVAGANTAAAALVADLTAQWCIWHRPSDTGAGSIGGVTSATAWSKFAVLRSRRD